MAGAKRRRLTAPSSLSPEGREAWREVVAAVRSLGREPSERDLFGMEALASCMARARQAREVLDREGITVVGANLAEVTHPVVAIEKAALAEARQVRASLGLFAGASGAKGIRTGGQPGRPKGASSAPDRAEPPRLSVVS